jgi:hypothetical protein
MSLRHALRAAVLVFALSSAGCTVISALVEVPSDLAVGSAQSIGGSFDAISTSSGSSGHGGHDAANELAYRRDLRAFTAEFATTAGGSRADFVRGVTRIAEDHGISDWESEAATPRAIGEGLRDARLSAAQMDAFVDSIGRDRPEAQLALDGYTHPGG